MSNQHDSSDESSLDGLPTTLLGALHLVQDHYATCCGGLTPSKSMRESMIFVHLGYQALQKEVRAATEGRRDSLQIVSESLFLAAAAIKLATDLSHRIHLDRYYARRDER